MRTYAKMRVAGGPGFVPSLSVGVIDVYEDDSVRVSEIARCHYRSLLSAGLPFQFERLYNRVAWYLGDAVHLLDFKTTYEFDVFSQIPERYMQKGENLTLLEDTYSFLRWDGSFVGISEDGFGSQRYLVRQKVLSCTTPVAGHVSDFTVLSEGETVKHAFDVAIYSRGWRISGILFEQRSNGRLLSAILHLPSGCKRILSPHG